ncbi:MAG TPA: VOC family protein [Iamia sp.]|jgi:2,3-dihydroxybiphenyl 1,2-dioxygenase|nr:VOC family protein [Iamia sp.]
MQHQIELGHLVIEVPDPTALTPTLAEVVGLEAGEPTPAGALTWRDDRRAQRLIVREGPANDAVAVGFEAVDAAAFDATVERLRAQGRDVVDDPELAAERRVARLVRTPGPWGPDVEVVLGAADAATPFASDLVPGGFLTEGVGFGHVVLATMAFDESVALLTEGLGFTQSDWLEMEIAEGIELEVRFFHCNARHHTVALAKAPFELPQTLHHVMFEMNDRDDVGAAFDRLWATDLGVPNGLGRHDNDGMFSFYLQTPAGFQIEVGHGARVITDDWDDDRAYDAISAWGHQPLRP